jgi:hypothetical protein
MATYDIKVALDQYFLDNWSQTSIQFQGQALDTTALDDFISLVYTPSLNDCYGLDGGSVGRIEYVGNLKVFCYAKNPTLAYKLADDVKTFLNGVELGNIKVTIGQDGNANDLENGFYECLCNFPLSEYA